MATASLGRLTLDLVARIGQFVEPMNRAEREARESTDRMGRAFSNFRDQMNQSLSGTQFGSALDSVLGRVDSLRGGVLAASGALAGMAVGGTALAIGGLAKMSIDAAKADAQMAMLANRAQIGIENFQIMTVASQQLGISQDQLGSIFADVQEKLGEFILRNIPPMVAGMPKIEVHFIIDADGILMVKAKELRSGIESSIDIRSTYGISEEQMALMLLDSIKNAEEDVQKRALLEAINEANNILLSSEKFIDQNKEILSVEEVATLRKYAGQLKNAVEAKLKDDIQSAIKELNDYSVPLAHRALDVNIGKALKGVKV